MGGAVRIPLESRSALRPGARLFLARRKGARIMKARLAEGLRSVVMLLAVICLLLTAVGCKPNIGRLLAKEDIDGLIEALDHEDAEIRRDAILALGELGGERAVVVIVPELWGGGWTVSKAAIEAAVMADAPEALANQVRQMSDRQFRRAIDLVMNADVAPEHQAAWLAVLVTAGDARSVTKVAELLEDADPAAQALVAQALGSMGEQSVDALVAASRGASGEARDVILDVLTGMGESAVEPLVVMLQEEDASLRQMAAQTLGALGDESAIDPLVGRLADSDRNVQWSAAYALTQFGEQGIAALWDAMVAGDAVKSVVRDALIQNGGEPAVALLTQELMNDSADLRSEAVSVLIRMGVCEPSVAAVAPDLKHQEARRRDWAANVLASSGCAEAVAPLIDYYRALCDQGACDACIEQAEPLMLVGRETATRTQVFQIEHLLLDALELCGDRSMAVQYLYSRNRRLIDAGEQWLRNHDESVTVQVPLPDWGSD